MLSFVEGTFGYPVYSADLDAYLLEDEQGKKYWLDAQVFAESVHDTIRLAGQPMTYSEAKDFNMAPGAWDIGMDGVTEA